jgi:predicted CopG family antitoxin
MDQTKEISINAEDYEKLLRRLYRAEDSVNELVRELERVHEVSNEWRIRDIAIRAIGRYKRDD